MIYARAMSALPTATDNFEKKGCYYLSWGYPSEVCHWFVFPPVHTVHMPIHVHLSHNTCFTATAYEPI